MKINFLKYHSGGNDFIIIDNIHKNIDLPKTIIEKLCKRKFGIGADGLILLERKENFDFQIVYFNSDGSNSLCCNGSRCAIRYFYYNHYKKNEYNIMAFDGPHKAFVDKNKIYFEMQDINNMLYYEEGVLIDTGAPHFVMLKENLYEDIRQTAFQIRNKYDILTNITFIKNDINSGSKIIESTTFEKGVEEETFSCGTGAVAAAILVNLKFNIDPPIKVKMKGGEYEVIFNKEYLDKKYSFNNIYINGNEHKVYEGKINL